MPFLAVFFTEVSTHDDDDDYLKLVLFESKSTLVIEAHGGAGIDTVRPCTPLSLSPFLLRSFKLCCVNSTKVRTQGKAGFFPLSQKVPWNLSQGDGAGAAGPDRRGDGDARRAVCGVVQAGPKTERKKNRSLPRVAQLLLSSLSRCCTATRDGQRGETAGKGRLSWPFKSSAFLLKRLKRCLFIAVLPFLGGGSVHGQVRCDSELQANQGLQGQEGRE